MGLARERAIRKDECHANVYLRWRATKGVPKRGCRKGATEKGAFLFFTFALKKRMFALRKASTFLRNTSIIKPQSVAAVRYFADAADEKPEEKGDPEVIAFINKVGFRSFYA